MVEETSMAAEEEIEEMIEAEYPQTEGEWNATMAEAEETEEMVEAEYPQTVGE